MPEHLPRERSPIRRRIVETWIPPTASTREQIAGLETIGAATWSVLLTMTGSIGTRAIFTRAVVEAARCDSRLGRVRVVDGGFDVDHFDEALADLDPDAAYERVVAVAGQLFDVADRLFGIVINAILSDIESELGRIKPMTARAQRHEDRT